MSLPRNPLLPFAIISLGLMGCMNETRWKSQGAADSSSPTVRSPWGNRSPAKSVAGIGTGADRDPNRSRAHRGADPKPARPNEKPSTAKPWLAKQGEGKTASPRAIAKLENEPTRTLSTLERPDGELARLRPPPGESEAIPVVDESPDVVAEVRTPTRRRSTDSSESIEILDEQIQPVSYHKEPEKNSQRPTLQSSNPGSAEDGNLAQVRKVVSGAVQLCKANPDYTCRVVRRERVAKKVLPEEVMMMRFRSNPRAVYYRWLDEGNAGRECVYADGLYNGKIMTLGGKGDFLLTGKRLPPVDPNGFLAKSKSRYPITESGLENMMQKLESVVAAQERGDVSRGVTRYLGVVRRRDLAGPVHEIEQRIPPKVDPYFADGAIRHWFFEVENSQLTLMTGNEISGEFIEYYRFDQFTPSKGWANRDFDPDVLWAKDKPATAQRTEAR